MNPRKRRIWLALAALTLVALVGRTQPIDAQSPAFVVPAKFDAEGFGQFLVPVTVRGNLFWCSLDSGGSWVFRLDTAKALAAGLKPNGTGSNAGVGPDVQRDERVLGVTAELGGLVLPNLTIVLSPIPEIIPDMDCVLGLGILQNHVAQFDYAKPELWLFEAAAFQPSAKATALPFEIDRFRNPYVTMPVQFSGDDSAAAALMLDTGASYYGVVLIKRFVDEQQVRSRTRRIAAQASQTPGLALSATRLPVLRVGSFEMRGPIAALIDNHSAGVIHAGLIGAGFFKHFTVTFDYGRRQMWLEQTSPFPAQQAFDASGIDFAHAPNRRYRVLDVAPDSPAAAAGVQRGDLLATIDGRDAQTLTLGQIKDMLRRSGETCRLTLDRGGMSHTVTLTLKERL